MGTTTKLALAGTFVAIVATAAAAFGQTGSGSSPNEGSGSRADGPRARRAAAQGERREGDRCPTHARRRLVHGESKVKAKDGFAVITVDQGEITAIDHAAKTITIKRLDGQTVTRTATDETKVCKDGDRAAFDSLKVGDHARLVYVRSERFTGLRRIAAVTPGAEQDESPRGRPASADELDAELDLAA